MERGGTAAWPRWTRVVIAVVALALLLAAQFGPAQAATPSVVVGWGESGYGEINVPAGLSGVTAIAAGLGHSLAIKRDGTVVAWGANYYGQTNIPAGLSNVTAIAAGLGHSLAVGQLSDTTAPSASPAPVGTQGANGWYTSDVTVNWGWTDNVGGSGIDPANCTTTSTSSGEGTIQLSATCKDLAGNMGTASVTLKIDKTAPTGVSGGAGNDRLTGGAGADSFDDRSGTDRATDRAAGEPATGVELFGP